jgi:hypothetical protein
VEQLVQKKTLVTDVLTSLQKLTNSPGVTIKNENARIYNCCKLSAVSETQPEYFITYGLTQLAFLAVPANPALANVVVIGVDVVDETPSIAEGRCNWDQI